MKKMIYVYKGKVKDLKTILFYENENNLITDFEDFLEENNYNIKPNSLVNDFYINEFLEQTFYHIENINTEKYFDILDKYCCKM